MDFIIGYIFIGFIFTVLLDFFIRNYKTSTPFTFLEILTTITIWPLILVIVIKGFFDGEY